MCVIVFNGGSADCGLGTPWVTGSVAAALSMSLGLAVEEPVPDDRYHAIYFAMLLAGVGFLLPYNSFITDVDYLHHKYPGAPLTAPTLQRGVPGEGPSQCHCRPPHEHPYRDLHCVRHEPHLHPGGAGSCASEQRAGGAADDAHEDCSGYAPVLATAGSVPLVAQPRPAATPTYPAMPLVA